MSNIADADFHVSSVVDRGSFNVHLEDFLTDDLRTFSFSAGNRWFFPVYTGQGRLEDSYDTGFVFAFESVDKRYLNLFAPIVYWLWRNIWLRLRIFIDRKE